MVKVQVVVLIPDSGWEKKSVLEQDLVLDYVISSARGFFNLRTWQCPVVNFELAWPPTSFSCPARLPGPLSAGRGFWGVTLMLTSVPGIVWPHEHVCSEVKDGSVYITCWLVTEELVTAINMCLVLWLAFASSRSLSLSLSIYIYIYYIYIYIYMFVCL